MKMGRKIYIILNIIISARRLAAMEPAIIPGY